jgi:hypothetical protein
VSTPSPTYNVTSPISIHASATPTCGQVFFATFTEEAAYILCSVYAAFDDLRAGAFSESGSTKIFFDDWLLLANTRFQQINRGFHPLDRQAATEPDVFSEQDLVGSHLHG